MLLLLARRWQAELPVGRQLFTIDSSEHVLAERAVLVLPTSLGLGEFRMGAIVALAWDHHAGSEQGSQAVWRSRLSNESGCEGEILRAPPETTFRVLTKPV